MPCACAGPWLSCCLDSGAGLVSGSQHEQLSGLAAGASPGVPGGLQPQVSAACNHLWSVAMPSTLGSTFRGRIRLHPQARPPETPWPSEALALRNSCSCLCSPALRSGQPLVPHSVAQGRP